MAPKIRSKSGKKPTGKGSGRWEEDWLDDEASSHRTGNAAQRRGLGGSRQSGRKEGDKVGLLDPSLANATVAEVFHKQCEVRFDDDGSRLLCPYRRAMVYGSGGSEAEGVRERSPVAVGDRVVAKRMSPTSGVVEALCRRRNFLCRPAPGRTEEVDGSILRHVVAANLDCLLIVASVKEPEFAPGLVDRYLVAAALAQVPAILCISKLDLLADALSPAKLYRDLGISVYEVCARTGTGVSELKEVLTEKCVAFCGHSGVGKTSLLQALLEREVGKIGSVNETTKKGKHTTSSAILLGGTGWIDTPGIREFGLLGLKPEDLRQFFPEFAELKCAEGDCWHRNEEGCVAKTSLRYESYLRILESLILGEN